MAKRTTVRTSDRPRRRGKHSIAEQPKRVMLPVGTAIGGLVPGIGTIDPSALQEVHDLAYVRKMRRFQ